MHTAESTDDLERLEREYIDLLLAGQRQDAAEHVLAHADAGVTVKDLYVRVFEPAQVETGRRWQRNEITVAHEHCCTAATQLIMSMLSPRVFTRERNGRRLVAAAVAGNLHEIGIRMVADFFEFDGWDTYFTGADTRRRGIDRRTRGACGRAVRHPLATRRRARRVDRGHPG